MNCRRAGRMIPLYAGGELSGAKARRLEEHLEECSDCRKMQAEEPDEADQNSAPAAPAESTRDDPNEGLGIRDRGRSAPSALDHSCEDADLPACRLSRDGNSRLDGDPAGTCPGVSRESDTAPSSRHPLPCPSRKSTASRAANTDRECDGGGSRTRPFVHDPCVSRDRSQGALDIQQEF